MALIHVRERFFGQVTEISLNAPPGNVLTRAFMEELCQQIEKDGANSFCKLIILKSAGSHFSDFFIVLFSFFFKSSNCVLFRT